MNETEAIKKAQEILKKDNYRDLTIDDGKELLMLEKYIDGDIFGSLIEAFYAAAPEDVANEFTQL